MEESFITYAMSVIVSRALPDVRDGLKPVQRRILYAMHELGLTPGRSFKKAATVVGDVLGKFHPHGDSSVYEALVRMVQDFSLRYPLVDGQGNFGSIDGDPAAAYRYTEARLMPAGVSILAGLEKQTVDFQPNYDDRLQEPSVLPAAFPALLVNGASGIAVGMATNMPPHNMREVVKAIIRVIEDPATDAAQLRRIVKGPDFPTAGLIVGQDGIRDYIETGRGKILNRARIVLEAKPGSSKTQLVVTELPYQANKARIIGEIANLYRDGKIDGISSVRDESDREMPVRIVIELRRDTDAQALVERLYKLTGLQTTFGVINLALVPDAVTGRLTPQILSLRELIDHYVAHRHKVLIRRTEFEKAQAEERLHVVEGLIIAVENIDEVVRLIKTAKDTAQAHARLRKSFGISVRQADAILNMRLAKLTGLEVKSLKAEGKALAALVRELKALLASEQLRMRKLIEEISEIGETYGDARRTEIVSAEAAQDLSETVGEAELTAVVTRVGGIMQAPLTSKRTRRTREKTVRTEHLTLLNCRIRPAESVLILADDGSAYSVLGSELPEPSGGRGGPCTPLARIIGIGKKHQPVLAAIVRDWDAPAYLTCVTATGQIKRTIIQEFRNARLAGIRGIKLAAGDRVISAMVTSGAEDILIATEKGMAIRFNEAESREMGRVSGGVRGIALKKGDRVIGAMAIASDAETIVVGTESGRAKKVQAGAFPQQGRAGQGVILIHPDEKAGRIVGLLSVAGEDNVLFLADGEVLGAVQSSEIPLTTRAARSYSVTMDSDEVPATMAVLDRHIE